jgi:hypothetical protein
MLGLEEVGIITTHKTAINHSLPPGKLASMDRGILFYLSLDCVWLWSDLIDGCIEFNHTRPLCKFVEIFFFDFYFENVESICTGPLLNQSLFEIISETASVFILSLGLYQFCSNGFKRRHQFKPQVNPKYRVPLSSQVK